MKRVSRDGIEWYLVIEETDDSYAVAVMFDYFGGTQKQLKLWWDKTACFVKESEDTSYSNQDKEQ